MQVIEKQGEDQRQPDALVIKIDRETDGPIFVDALYHVAFALSEIARARAGRGEESDIPEELPSADEVGVRAAELNGYFGFESQGPSLLHQTIMAEAYSIELGELARGAAQAFCRQLDEEFGLTPGTAAPPQTD